MWQTIQDIEDEIKDLNARGSKAWNALQALAFKDHKKREAKRRELESEVKAVKQMIIYAKEAIRDEM